jgi:hypothetical protein
MTSVLIKRLSITLLALVLSAATDPTFAGVALNTIDPVAHQTENGRQIVVTGPIACTAGEGVTLRVTVTQRSRRARPHAFHVYRRSAAVGSLDHA